MSKPRGQIVWVVTAISESSDHYGPVVFAHKPSDPVLKALCDDWDAGEWDGPGDYDSYCYLSVDKATIRP